MSTARGLPGRFKLFPAPTTSSHTYTNFKKPNTILTFFAYFLLIPVLNRKIQVTWHLGPTFQNVIIFIFTGLKRQCHGIFWQFMNQTHAGP